MRTTSFLIAVTVVAGVSMGCSHGQDEQQVRVSDPDAGGPIVNPRAPGAQSGAKGAAATQEYTAPPGMKTGIPK